MKKVKRGLILLSIISLFIILTVVTNPTTEDYLQFTKEETGVETPPMVEIERINFYLFSTYAPVIKPIDEHGMVHLGFMGRFYQISNGQFDYPWWLEFFN